MKKIQLGLLSFVLLVLTLSISSSPLTRLASAHDGDSPKLTYPETKRGDVVDNYFGTSVPDPYRWLEDDNSPEVSAWVEAENKVTFGYLDKIPYRAQLKDRLTKLLNYPKYSAPARRTGKYVGYGISEGGSDWNEIYVLDVATKKPLADHLEWVKFSGASWRGDEGFYYNRYPTPAAGKKMAAKNELQKVYYHKIGTPQSTDGLVFEDNEHPGRFNGVGVTEDERFEVRSQSDPAAGKKGNSLFVRDLSKGEKTFTTIVAEIGDDDYDIVDDVAGKFLIRTNHSAPNGKIVLWDPQDPQKWTDVVPEKPEPLEGANTVGGKLFVTYLKDVTTHAYVYNLAGKLENEIAMPGPGSAGGFGGRDDDKFTFYSFTSFNYPPTIYKYDIATRKSSVFRTVDIPGFNPANYETREVFYNSKDGTRVPMFITNRKGIKLDGNNPTVLYGYGGFNITTSPGFSALRIALLEQGVVYASANIRGGGEYGEKWHEAGTKLKKQNVFDDFIAAAEYLIKERITSPGKLAIHGGSNGGLLVGACSNQRPELFKAVIEQAGVMDMLRFHKFTIGAAWISDYGSSDNAEQFKALYAISPIHNIKPGTKYPATLITTADHDDRVVPAHNFKYAAALQAAQGGDNPILIRIDTKSGHGASSTTKTLEQQTDLFSFLFENLGVTPKW